MAKETSTAPKTNETHMKSKHESYKAAYEAAKKAGKLDRPTYRIHTWNEDSALIIGNVTAIEEFKGGKFEADVNAYRIDTDDGPISCILGSYTDAQLAGSVKVGTILMIQFQGQKELEDGRKVNMFDVDIIEGGGD